MVDASIHGLSLVTAEKTRVSNRVLDHSFPHFRIVFFFIAGWRVVRPLLMLGPFLISRYLPLYTVALEQVRTLARAESSAFHLGDEMLKSFTLPAS